MNTTIANGEKIPWYRGRLFWGLVLSPLLLFSSLVFFESLPSNSLLDSFFDLTTSFGGFLLIRIVASFFDFSDFGKIVGMLFYSSVFILLVYKTFSENKVRMKYPILLILFISSGLITLSMILE